MPAYTLAPVALGMVLPGTAQEAARALLTATAIGVLGEESSWSGNSRQGLYGYELKSALEKRLGKRTFIRASPEWYPFLYGLEACHLIQGSAPHRHWEVHGQGNRQLIPTARGAEQAVQIQQATSHYQESHLGRHLHGIRLAAETFPGERTIEHICHELSDLQIPSNYHIHRGRTVLPVDPSQASHELPGTQLLPSRTCQEFADALLMTYQLLQLNREQPREWNQGLEPLANDLKKYHSRLDQVVRNEPELYMVLRGAKRRGFVAAYRDGEVLDPVPEGFRGRVLLTPRGRRFGLKMLAYTQISFKKGPFYQWVSAASPVSLREISLLGEGNKIPALYNSVRDLICKV